ncbi:hypothetical protein [Longirhabdus pacifica]|uniref:hypothetical protein n=1 Tax=Longirhabdus pacifica TaxID=2305227 RepID=UPI001008A9A9|nr:hypothetical protein [Longirhabdus pacifica]
MHQKKVVTLSTILILMFIFTISYTAVGEKNERNDDGVEGEWNIVTIPSSNGFDAILNINAQYLNEESTFSKTIVASNQPDTNWQHVIDGIKKFHDAVDKNTLDFSLNKAITIVNNNPALQLITTLSAYPVQFSTKDTDPYRVLTEYLIENLQMNTTENEFQELYQEVRGSTGSNNYYYKLLLAIDFNGNIELIHFKLHVDCCTFPKDSAYDQLLLYAYGLKAVYTPK